MGKRVVKIETQVIRPALQAIHAYFDGSGYSLSQVLAILEKDRRYDFQVGRGGQHVWVADMDGNRLLIIT